MGNAALATQGQLVPTGAGGLALQQQAAAEPSYPASVLLRLVLWAPVSISSLVGLVMPAAFLIGILADRHRVLDEPGEHLPLLRRTAVLGLAMGWGAGTVQALLHLGVLVVPNPSAFVSLHLFIGIFAGVGAAALFGLIAHRVGARGATPPLPVRALVALGRRSLSGYLAHLPSPGPTPPGRRHRPDRGGAGGRGAAGPMRVPAVSTRGPSSVLGIAGCQSTTVLAARCSR